jgi:predicted Zn-dependent protease
MKPASGAFCRRVVLTRLSSLALAGSLLVAQEPPLNKEKEAALGAAMARQVQNDTATVDDSTVHDYIQPLGRRLAAQVRSGDFQWEFVVIRDNVGGSTHEPLSIPGGHIFVPVSLILAANSEAELAGMLAHSMAHIVERHRVRMAGTANLTVFYGSRMWNDDGPPLPAESLRAARDNELDADRVAGVLMAAAGYDPTALIGYLRRTQGPFTTWAATRSLLPPREARISALEAVVANLPPPAIRPDFKTVQDKVRDLSAPPPSTPKKPPTLLRDDEQ